ncbi:nitrate reductase subunit alpha, partial [Paraburkholderia ferrariae]
AERADKGKWNLEARDGSTGAEIDLALSQKDSGETVEVGLDYFGGDEHHYFTAVAGDAIQYKTIPCRTINLANGQTAKVVTVFDLMVANLGVANGVGGQHVTDDYNDATVAGTPAWQEAITGVSREKVIQIAREFAENAHKTHGKSMIIIGA